MQHFLSYLILSSTFQILGGTVLLILVFTLVIHQLRRRNILFAEVLLPVRSLLVPAGGVILFLHDVERLAFESTAVRMILTVFWIGVIWVIVSYLKLYTFGTKAEDTWREKMPGLLVDLILFAVVVVSAFMVVTMVWDGNPAHALATLGVGSLVIGLALQDTLGNLMAGIALLLERPFQVGDWIKIGDVVGEILEMNWRAVHIRPRSLDLVVVPNSVLGKERIHNFSRPSKRHAIEMEVSFAFHDPPNKVERVLSECAQDTLDILPEGIAVRTKSFGDFSIAYQIRVFIERYERLPDIQEEFMTRVWYQARRHGLTMPFPIRNVFKTELPHVPTTRNIESVRQALHGVGLLEILEHRELTTIAESALVQEFAAGEKIVRQGDAGDALYIMMEGAADVVLRRADGQDQVLSRVTSGHFFGEMALLTGEVRTATVVAVSDVTVAVIHKEALRAILTERPAIAEALANLVEARRRGLQEIAEMVKLSSEERAQATANSRDILGRIKRFFSI